MRNKSSFYGLYVFVLVVVATLSSCQKDIYSPEPVRANNWAQEYYQNVLLKNKRDKKTGTQSTATGKGANSKANFENPLWDRAIAGETGIYSYVEVPLGATQKRGFFIGKKMDIAELKRRPLSFERLIIYKDKNGRINQRVVAYLPRQPYNADKISLTHLDDFTGQLIYQDWAGKILFVLQVNEGKATRLGAKTKG